MTDIRRPSVIVFDVNETLLDLTSLEPVFERIFEDGTVMREWFAQLILYSEALTLMGKYTPFAELAGGALRMVGETKGITVQDGDIKMLKEHIGTMPALPDVPKALEKLRVAGFRLVTLTNSAPSPSPTPLDRAGLAEYFDASFSVDEVGRFKPAPEVYLHVAKKLDIEMKDICMVACHLWDTIGAQAAGCVGALITRPGNAVLHAEGVPLPDIVSDDMISFADEIIARWGKSTPA